MFQSLLNKMNKDYSTIIGAVDNNHLYGGEYYPPLYEFLTLVLDDINNKDLLTDSEYCQEFLDVFNTKELWSSEKYIKMVESIIDQLPDLEYPQTIKALNNYGIIANCHNYIYKIHDLTGSIKYFNESANEPDYISTDIAYENLKESVNQEKTDSLLFKLVSNCVNIRKLETQYIHLIYQLQSKYKPENPAYYLSFIDNMLENHVVFSKEFLVSYLHDYLNSILNIVKNTNYEISQYYNCLSRMEEEELCYGINNLFESTVIDFTDLLIDECRPSYFVLKQAYTKMGIQESEITLINNIIAEIDSYSIITNSGKLSNILKTENLLPINKEAINSALSSINETLFENASTTEVKDLTRLIQYSKDDSKKSYAGQVSTTIGAVLSSVTPEVLNSSSRDLVKDAYSKLSNQVSVTSGRLTVDNDDYLDIKNEINSKVGFINNQVAQLLNTHSIGIDLDLDFLDAINNLKYELGLFDNFIGDTLCSLKNLLCIGNKILSFIKSLSAIEDLVKDGAQKALELANTIEDNLKKLNEKDLTVSISSKVEEIISNKMNQIVDQIKSLVGEEVAAQFMSCYSANGNSVASGLLNGSLISTAFNSFADSLYDNLMDQFSDVFSSGNCQSKLNIPGINIPSLTFSGLDFNLPKFTLKLLNCK